MAIIHDLLEEGEVPLLDQLPGSSNLVRKMPRII
jgi:hypothetical protein